MAGRRMPHNNRVSGSAALRTNDIWSKTIGHNPYKNEDDDNDGEEKSDQAAGLMLLAKMTNVSGSEIRGGCSKCGMMGHLRFQCRNTIQLAKPTDDDSSSSSSSDEEEEAKPELRPPESWGTKLDSPKERDKNAAKQDRGRDSGRDDRKRRDDRSRSRDRDDDRKKSKKHSKHKEESKEKKHKEKSKKSKSDKKDHKSKKSRKSE